MDAKQGYIKGMDQDTSSTKRDPQAFYYGRNFRLITDGGLSNGSIENELGHTHSCTIPNLPEMILLNGNIIPAQTDLKIIEVTSMVDTLIIFTTSFTGTTPNPSYGQVWKCKFDESTGEIIGLVGNSLDPAIHLCYNNAVNFSTEYRIKAVARYENSNTQRVYWTDFYNSVRVLNVANPTVSIELPVENLDLRPGIFFGQPNILSIGTGNVRTGCVAQFGYRLIDTQGAESLYSPISVVVPLPSVDYGTVPYEGFTGTGSALVKNKSVTYEINGIDQDYNVIEHIAILTTESGTKEIYKFGEDVIPTTGNMLVVCDDLDDAIEISLVEFNMMNSGFDKAKDIVSHGNRLIAANTKTLSVDIPFDSRAYRFNTASQSLLEGTPNITLLGPGPAYNLVPSDHDAINPYNNEDDAAWFTTNQYKYQADGITLGGSGANISYKFVTEDMSVLLSTGVDAPHFQALRANSSTPISTLNVTDPGGATRVVVKDTQFRDFSSSWAHGNFAGYARGETYRFGIVFYNKKGTPSFVNWIGDIRFPDVEDGFPLQTGIAGSIGGNVYLHSLGIEFEVDVTSINEHISGFSIVRLQREEQDCTKLGTGMLMFFDRQENTYENSLLHRWEDSGPNAPGGPNSPYELNKEVNIAGTIVPGNYHLSDKPGFNMVQTAFASAKRMCYLLSPLGQVQPINHKAGDYIDTRGYYSGRPELYGGDYTVAEADRDYAFRYNLKEYAANPHARERFEIDRAITARVGEYFLSSGGFVGGSLGANNLMNASYVKDKILGVETATTNVPLGMGSQKLLLALSSTNTITNGTGDPGDAAGNAGNMRWYDDDYCGPDSLQAGSVSIDFNLSNLSTTDVYFKEIVYARFLANQYGGNSYASRSVNKYMSTGHFQSTNSATVFTFKVFGGDTFVTYYDEEQIQQYWDTANFNDLYKVSSTNKLGVAACFPVESRVNPCFRTGKHWAADRDGTNLGAYESNSWSLPNVWTTENTVEEKFFAKDFLSNFVEEHPHQIWASDPKIDGELIDSWRSFKIANAADVEGTYGPINRLISHNDALLYYQDKAFGVASIDERSLINDESGQQLVLGVGGVFPDFGYISKNTGCYHQYAVVPTEAGVYHYDARLNKMVLYTGGPQPISDLKSMHSFFRNNVLGSIRQTDKTLRQDFPEGIHGTYDPINNRVLFTFLNNNAAPSYETYLVVIDGLTYLVVEDNTYFIFRGDTYYAPNAVTVLVDDVFNPDNLPQNFTKYSNSFTLSYNELTGSYENFYDYVPGIYHDYGRRLLAVSPHLRNELYEHNKGTASSYYGRAPVKSVFHTILAAGGDMTKIYNNLEYQSELSLNGVDIYDETLNRVTIYNDYQTTGTLELIVGDNIKRRMRTWRYIIPRDVSDPNNPLARIRNPWAHLIVEYDNNLNKRLLLHDITYRVTPSKM